MTESWRHSGRCWRHEWWRAVLGEHAVFGERGRQNEWMPGGGLRSWQLVFGQQVLGS
jgi:hypothetical protein